MKYTPDPCFPQHTLTHLFCVTSPSILHLNESQRMHFLVTWNLDMSQADKVSVGHWEAQKIQETES